MQNMMQQMMTQMNQMQQQQGGGQMQQQQGMGMNQMEPAMKRPRMAIMDGARLTTAQVYEVVRVLKQYGGKMSTTMCSNYANVNTGMLNSPNYPWFVSTAAEGGVPEDIIQLLPADQVMG